MAFLELQHLRKRYGDVVAVDRVSLSVERGEFVSLLGPSGCGKTTTLQMIAGFVEPTEGTIRLDGRDLNAVKANERGLGVVFQSYALFPHMTVAENVAFGLEMRRVPPAERRRRVADMLDLVRLGPLQGRHPGQLSGGQRQRVALARALVIEPPVLLLDEPLSNLDAKLREDMQLELRRIQRTVGTTTIMVTHDQSEAMALSDRVAVMNHGLIEQVGPPHAVYDRPATTFVSAFLGKTNLIQGVRARSVTGEPEIVVAGHRFRIEGPSDAVPEAIHASLRPEKIRLVRAEAGPAQVRGTVRMRMFLGDHWIYDVESPIGALLVHRQNDGEAVDEGAQVGLAWDTVDLRVVGEGAHA